MHRIDHATAAPGNQFTEGNPATATPATKVTDDWLNDVQENVCAVVEAAGIALVKGTTTQLRDAIQSMITGAQKAVVIKGVTFEASVTNGKVVRWDSGNSRFDEAVADSTSNDRAVGVADVTNSQVYLFGECPIFSGLTLGARYYLDPTTPGALTASAPADAVMVGIAKSATTLWVDIDSATADLRHGQCRLAKSGANLVLVPFNGNNILINGVRNIIPAAGVSLGAGGLAASTTYFIYAYMNGATMTLEASATGHSTDATTGVEIKTGDVTRTLVGMARTSVGTAWVHTRDQQFVRSWFNRERLIGGRDLQATRSTTSGAQAETSSADRAEFLSWAGEQVALKFDGDVTNSVAAGNVSNYVAIYLDSTTSVYTMLIGTPAAGIYINMASPVAWIAPAEGYHYISPYISQSLGGTFTLLVYSGVSLWS